MHKSAFQGVRAAALAIVALTATPGHAGSKASPEMAATKVPIVRQTVLAFDVGTAGGLSADERRSLSEWFDGIKVRYGDRVSVDAAGASPALAAAVADVLAEYGLLLSEHAPATAGSGNGPRVVVMRAAASAEGCPDWSRPSNPEFSASKTSNYGCAMAGAMSAIVADPNDLVAGKSYGGTDAITVSKAIETYRTKAAQGTNKVTSSVGSAAGK